MLASKHLPCPTKAALNFIGNQQNAMLLRDTSQFAHKLTGGRHKAALAQHRLDNNRGHTLRDHGGEKEFLQSSESTLATPATVFIRIGCVVDFRREGARVLFVARRFTIQ